MKIFVITIRPDRLGQFEERCGSWCSHLTVVEGVDGRKLDKNSLVKSGIFRPSNSWHAMTKGEIGCFLSHRAIWEHVAESQEPEPVVIMEDDCLFDSSLHGDRLNDTMRRIELLDAGWRILLLSRAKVMRNNIKSLNKDFVVPARSWGLHCYAISAVGARILLRDSKRGISEAVDTFVSTRTGGLYALANDLCGVDNSFSDTTNIK